MPSLPDLKKSDHLTDSSISHELLHDSVAFPPLETPLEAIPPTDGQTDPISPTRESPNLGAVEVADEVEDWAADSNTLSRMLRMDFVSVMDELEDAVGTIRRIWGQRDTQDVAYVRPDGVLVTRDGVEYRKRNKGNRTPCLIKSTFTDRASIDGVE